MSGCCDNLPHDPALLKGRQRIVLVQVLWINAAMFLLEFTAGWWADSSALLADSLDMLGDALTYGISLYALSRSVRWQSGAALAKGSIQAVFGVGVLLEVIAKILHGGAPAGGIMAGVALLALAVNGYCLYSLTPHRNDNLNMESVWLCSRNDVIGNAGVLLAAAGVHFTGSAFPDIIVGAMIAAIFLRTAFSVIGRSLAELRRDSEQSPGV